MLPDPGSRDALIGVRVIAARPCTIGGNTERTSSRLLESAFPSPLMESSVDAEQRYRRCRRQDRSSLGAGRLRLRVSPDLYYCPDADEIECPRHSGFDTCCAAPGDHVGVR